MPRRTVSFSAKASCICSGFLTQFGCLFGGFGTVFVWGFLFAQKSGSSPFDLSPLLITSVFPLVGALMIASQIPKKLRWIDLLAVGERAIAEYSRNERTNMRINEEPVYKVFYSFKTDSGAVGEVSASTTDVQSYSSVAQREVLYDPQNPDQAMVLDELPRELTLDYANRVALKSLPKRLFILPAATILGNISAFIGYLT